MPDDDSSDLHDVETPIEQQVSERIDAQTTPLELVAALDDSALASRPEAEAGHGSKFPIDAMVRLELGKRISELSDKDVVERLKERPELAANIGLGDGVPDLSIVSRWRSEYYGEELDAWIDRARRRVVETAIEMGNPMGFDSLESEDREEASGPTKSRHKKERRNKAAEETVKVLATVYTFLRADNTTYPMETFLRVLAEMSKGDLTPHEACGTDDDAFELVNLKPAADTFRHHPNELEPAKLVRMHDRVVEVLIEQIKQYIEFERPVKIGIDWTTIPIPGDPEQIDPAVENIGGMFEELDAEATGQFVMGSEEESDEKVYKLMTLNIVGQHFRIPLVVRPMPKGVPYAVIVRELFWRARELVSIEEMYMDGAFYGAGVFQSLHETGSDYVVAAPRDPRIERWLDAADNDVAVKQDHGLPRRPTEPGPEYVRTNLVAMPSHSNPERTVVFATNKAVRDEIGYDRARAVEKVETYSQRGEQEKCYEMVKDFLAPTESDSFRLHLLFFLFSCVAYAMWKLVDFRVKRDMGVELDADTMVEFSDFLKTMRDYLFRGG